jgi:transglutaminase-like putative cysteine protease
MKKIALFLFFLISISWSFFGQVQQKDTPSWVQKTSYAVSPDIDLDENSQGILKLLYDNQVNRSTQEIYFRDVSKIEENVGLQSASSINVDYDPTYQSLTFHEIKVIRDGKTISKLNPDDFQLIRREKDAESYIYDGTLSATNNLSDIRRGDIIDYSYTVTGMNPIHGNKFSRAALLNDYVPYGKVNVMVLSKTPVEIQMMNTSQEFSESKANGMYKYQYTKSNVDALEFEENTPSWVIWSEIAFFSDYTSWGEVAEWGAGIFRVRQPASTELRTEINRIKKEFKSEGERITAVLNFVQDEIRYLGLESGIGAYKPFMPNKVLQQRYGDCKDKSLLMVYMLRKMDIEAYPVLVNTTLKHSLKKLIPSPKYFDHCIVKVVPKRGKARWYDPTISNQGGDYLNTSIPDYRVGLVLDTDTQYLEDIKQEAINLVDVTDEFILDDVGKGATLKCITQYYDLEADIIRNHFKNNGIKSIRDEYEKYLANFYGNIRATQNPTYQDDLGDNVFTVTEYYEIDSLWTDSPIDNKNTVATFQPYIIINGLAMPSKRERKYPFALYYPSTKNHTISLKLPRAWNIEPDYVSDAHENLYYSLATSYDPTEREVIARYSIKTKDDHASPETFNDFYNTMNKINSTISYSLIYPKKGANSISSFSMPSIDLGGFVWQLLLMLVVVVILIIITGKLINKSSETHDKKRHY